MKESNMIVRIDGELKECLKVAAKKEGLTLSKLVLRLVNEYLSNEPQKENVYTKGDVKNESVYTNVPQPQNKPVQPAKTKKDKSKKGIYSTAKRQSAKDSPNRVVLKF